MKMPVGSHTFLNTWANCAHKAYRMYIAKDLPRQPASQAMTWGINVHSAFEVRIKHGTPFPKEMPYEVFAAPLVAAGAKAELALGITATGAPCDFFAKDVWLRGKLDAPVIQGTTAAIMDIKTGKRREEADELRIHAVLLKAAHPTIQKVTGFYIWLQDMQVGKAHDVSDTAKTLEDVRYTMAQVANAIEIEDFPKRPNPLCGWCGVMDCEHNKKGR